MPNTQKIALMGAAILWVIWGIVHALASILIIAGDTVSGFQAIGDAVAGTYHATVGAVLDQHAWNLLWFGVVTMVPAVLIWNGAVTAIWVTAMVGGLADQGYFMLIDLGGHAKFFPGTVMMIVPATAIVLSFWVWLSGAGPDRSHGTPNR